jgi:hypothetical protein
MARLLGSFLKRAVVYNAMNAFRSSLALQRRSALLVVERLWMENFPGHAL